MQEKRSWFGRITQRSINSRITVYVGGSSWKAHLNLQEISDDDGIFLHLQGQNMTERKRTYKDYYTSSSADVLVNSFRRWLDAAAQATAKTDVSNAIDAVQSASGSDYFEASLPAGIAESRRTMLDLYASHTKSCKICSVHVYLAIARRAPISLSTHTSSQTRHNRWFLRSVGKEHCFQVVRNQVKSIVHVIYL